jgi:hypothetical protein
VEVASESWKSLTAAGGEWQQIFGDFVHEAIGRASLTPRCPDTPSLDPHYQTYTLLLSATRSSSTSLPKHNTLPQLPTLFLPLPLPIDYQSPPRSNHSLTHSTTAPQIHSSRSRHSLVVTTPITLPDRMNRLQEHVNASEHEGEDGERWQLRVKRARAMVQNKYEQRVGICGPGRHAEALV